MSEPLAVIAIPGVPGSRVVWTPLLEHLGERCRVRHFPLESVPLELLERDDAFETLEAQLLELVRALGGECILLGHSFGAWLAARVLDRVDPERTRAVLLSGMASLTETHAAMLGELHEAITSGAMARDALVALVVDLTLGAGCSTAEDRDRVEAMIEAMGMERLARFFARESALADERWHVRAHPVRTVVVHTRGDRAMAVDRAHELVACGARSRLQLIDDDSHLPHWVVPAEIARHVEDFGDVDASSADT